MDEQFPDAITEALRRRGVDVLTTQEDDHRGTPDTLLLDRATLLGRVLVTQDKHFLREATTRQADNIPFAGIIYARYDPARIGRYVQDLELIGKAGYPQDYIQRLDRLPLSF